MYCWSGPTGTIEPARTTDGSRSNGASAVIVCCRRQRLPVQKSYHVLPAGR
jgi:hypothetical protein